MCHPSWQRALTRRSTCAISRGCVRVRDRIDREYAQPLDVEALARGAHMSAGNLSREFRAAYGKSPHAYLMDRRIERAMVLMRWGDLGCHRFTERRSARPRKTGAELGAARRGRRLMLRSGVGRASRRPWTRRTKRRVRRQSEIGSQRWRSPTVDEMPRGRSTANGRNSGIGSVVGHGDRAGIPDRPGT